MTCAPRWYSFLAVARPMPALAPVIRQVCGAGEVASLAGGGGGAVGVGGWPGGPGGSEGRSAAPHRARQGPDVLLRPSHAQPVLQVDKHVLAGVQRAQRHRVQHGQGGLQHGERDLRARAGGRRIGRRQQPAS